MLTPRQKQIKDYISEFISKKGLAPTERDPEYPEARRRRKGRKRPTERRVEITEDEMDVVVIGELMAVPKEIELSQGQFEPSPRLRQDVANRSSEPEAGDLRGT